MTAQARLLELRRALVLVLAARAVLIGVSVAFGLFTLARIVSAPAWSIAVALVASVAAVSVQLLRLQLLRSLSRVALWVEERTPQLRYALVSIADGVQSPALEAQAPAEAHRVLGTVLL